MTAIVVVSESEIAKVISNWTFDFPQNNPVAFRKILWDMGIDTNQTFEIQEGFTHRNRLNEVVLCNRFVGIERSDKEWISSGYASREARNDSSGSKLLKDMDRYKYETL